MATPRISGQNFTSPRVDISLSHNDLISGKYKILAGTLPYADWTGPRYPNNTGGGIKSVKQIATGCLYNIADDPGEHVNLAESETDVLKSMQTKLAHYISIIILQSKSRI